MLQLPGIVFARGGAVGILMLLECEGEVFTVLTEQVRKNSDMLYFRLTIIESVGVDIRWMAHLCPQPTQSMSYVDILCISSRLHVLPRNQLLDDINTFNRLEFQ